MNKNMERRVGSSLTTASGGNFVRGELNRNERSVRWTVAKIEIAGKQNQAKNMERRVEKVRRSFSGVCHKAHPSSDPWWRIHR